MKTRLFATLCVAMFFLSSWANGVNIGGIYYLLDDNNKTATVTYTGTSIVCGSNPAATAYLGNITIPSSVKYNRITYSVTSIGQYAFANCSDLTSVTIPKSVKSIGYNAFQNSEALASVYISDLAVWCSISFAGATSNPLWYAKDLFLNGKKITDLVVPGSVTSIEPYAFYNYSNLTSVTIPKSVKSIGKCAFLRCSGLTSITIPSSVTRIEENTFGSCRSLKSITIPQSVTFIGSYAFSDCTGLTSVEIPNSVTSIGDRAFLRCTNLTSVTIGSGVKSIEEYAFAECKKLTEIVSLSYNPYDIAYSAFDSETYAKTGTLYIHEGTIDKYMSKKGWKEFRHVEDGVLAP